MEDSMLIDGLQKMNRVVEVQTTQLPALAGINLVAWMHLHYCKSQNKVTEIQAQDVPLLTGLNIIKRIFQWIGNTTGNLIQESQMPVCMNWKQNCFQEKIQIKYISHEIIFLWYYNVRENVSFLSPSIIKMVIKHIYGPRQLAEGFQKQCPLLPGTKKNAAMHQKSRGWDSQGGLGPWLHSKTQLQFALDTTSIAQHMQPQLCP